MEEALGGGSIKDQPKYIKFVTHMNARLPFTYLKIFITHAAHWLQVYLTVRVLFIATRTDENYTIID